jgi:2-polyprenyl-3-methyl-5-hydroxy-6-metoxy-1,4-benzoquinol methylase
MSVKYYIKNYDFTRKKAVAKIFKNQKALIDIKNKNILDLGSGTGYFAINYAQLGSNVTCIDISDDFIEVFKKKLENYPTIQHRIKIIKCNMRSFNLNQMFDLICINGNSFVHMLTQKDQISCLESIKKHLKPDGKAIINIIPPSDRLYEKIYLKRLVINEDENVKYQEIVSSKINYFNNIITYKIIYKVLNGPKKNKIYTESIDGKMVTRTELELLFKLVDLKIIKIYGDFYSHKIGPETFEFFYVVAK